MCLFLRHKPPKNDQNNVYIRLKCFQFPFHGDVVVTKDFKQEYTFEKMSKEEFIGMVKTISSECRHFHELKLTYLFTVILLIILHISFPHFLFTNNDDSDRRSIIPIVLFLVIYTVFTLKILRITQNILVKIQKILRTENCLKYISRGLCWKLDPNREYLHLSLDYSSTSNQYLIGEAMNHQNNMEEQVPYFDLENGDFWNISSENQHENYMNRAFLRLALCGGLIAVTEVILFGYSG